LNHSAAKRQVKLHAEEISTLVWKLPPGSVTVPARMTTPALRNLAIAVLALAATASSASASQWRTDPEADAHALGRLGVRVDWPMHDRASAVTAGAELTIGVRSTRRTTVEVSFLRVTADGSVMRRLADRRIRQGHVIVKVPSGVGRTYQLRLSAGALRYRSPVTAAPANSTIEPASAVTPTVFSGPADGNPSPVSDPPPPTIDPAPDCPLSGIKAAELRLDQPDRSYAPGDVATYTLANTGDQCLGYGIGVTWERQGSDGTWTIWPTDDLDPAILMTMYPATSESGQATVPVDATTGRYRVLKLFDPHSGGPGGPDAYDLKAAAELDVVAPPS
jgi:hypothetical protein